MSLDSLQTELADLHEKNLFRLLRQIDSTQDPIVSIEGRNCVNFSSNNYLGLANDPRLKSASILATEKHGAGSGASRLVTGSMKLHHKLEEKIAQFKGAEAALLFNSGYHANIGILSALLREGDFIFSDELNHASIIDGCRLSRATTKVYRHRDVEHLEELLKNVGGPLAGPDPVGAASSAPTDIRRLIVTDSIFSMDGDAAPLKELMALAEKYECWLMVDEAHATGIYGPNGKGLVEEILPLTRPTATLSPEERGIRNRLIQMGTLGKALGSFGAYVAGPKTLIQYLINKARSFIYTTALPPGPIAAALAAIEIVEQEPERRKKLWENVEYFESRREETGDPSTKLRAGRRQKEEDRVLSPIIPILVGDSRKTLEISRQLFEKGLLVTAIRYPTVPRGTERLRITLMATHTKEQIDQLIGALNELL